MLCSMCCVLEECGSCISIEFHKLCIYFADNLDFMGPYFRVEVTNLQYHRLLRKKLWPTDYEKVMQTVKRKLIAKNLFDDSFVGNNK